MNFLRNKQKFIAKITVLLMGAMMMVTQTINITFAATFACEDFNPPGEGQTDKTVGYIVTILEEQIGSPTTSGDSGEMVYNCFRETATCSGSTQECALYKSSCSSSDTTKCKRVQIFVAQSGAELLFSYVGRIYKWAAGTIGIVAVLYLVWGGVEMSTAGGDQGKYEKAKERIMQSLAGLVILFLSALILYTINPNFFTLS